MKILLILLSIFGLVLTIVPSIMVFIQKTTIEEHKQIMFFGMFIWFITAPLWIKEQEL